MIGTVYQSQPLLLHRRIGEAKNETSSIQVLVKEPTGEPMIVHEDGRTFILTWDDIMKLAQEAFAADSANPESTPSS